MLLPDRLSTMHWLLPVFFGIAELDAIFSEEAFLQ
jgi:hypothetical protein